MHRSQDVQLSIQDLEKSRCELVGRSPLPIYYQVALVLQDFIEMYRPVSGTLFFSENEIAEALGVSRLTTNRAVKTLIERGCLTRERGQRARLCALHGLPIVHMGELLSIGQTARNGGVLLDTELVDRGKLEVPYCYVKQALGLSPKGMVVHLTRTLSTGGQGVLTVESFLPSPSFDGLLTCGTDAFQEDLYVVMQKVAGIGPARVEREVWASRASSSIASVLHLLPWDPCLRIRSLTYDSDETPILMCDSWLSSLGCTLTSSLTRGDRIE